jgi:hypothetical protein
LLRSAHADAVPVHAPVVTLTRASALVSIVTVDRPYEIPRTCTASKLRFIAYVSPEPEKEPWSYAVSDDLPLGAHLVSQRRGYLHHGVYAGNGRVIHYGGFSRLFSSRPVEEVSLDEFTLGRGLQVKPWVAPTFTGADVVERARSRIGENRYRLFSNNCEHFTEWCIGGKSRSRQVEALKARFTKRLARFAKLGATVASGSGPLAA